MKILSYKINRTKFFAGWVVLAIFLSFLNVCIDMLENAQMTQHNERLMIAWILSFLGVILWFIFLILIFNARCNDIGLSTGEKIGAFVASLIPFIGLFVFLYLLFKKGDDCEQYLRSQQSVQTQTNDNHSRPLENLQKVKKDLLMDLKKFWLLVFCIVTLATCIFYVPYNMVHPEMPNVVTKQAYGTLFEIPKGFRQQVTRIDYMAIAFREILVLIGCCAGYTVSTIVKRK